MYPTLSSKLLKRYDGMTLTQLHEAILQDDQDSPVVLMYLLRVRFEGMLEKEYDFFVDDEGRFEQFTSFEDTLSQLNIELWKGHPESQKDATSFYYLRAVRDSRKLDSWLKTFYHHFLQNLRKTKEKLDGAVKEFETGKVVDAAPSLEVSLHRIAYSMAKFNQHEGVEDRYLLFRSLRKDVVDNYVRMEELTDQETAEAMGVKYSTFRSKVSRNSRQLRDYVSTISHADIQQLNAASLYLVNRIISVEPQQIGDIVMDLMDDAERQLPCYQMIVEARNRKVQAMFSSFDTETILHSLLAEQHEMDFLQQFVDNFEKFVSGKK